MGGQKLDLTALDSSIQLLPGQGGLQVTRLAILYQAHLPAGITGNTPISFTDNNYNDRAGWKIVVRSKRRRALDGRSGSHGRS